MQAISYLGVLAAIAAALSILMMAAWVVYSAHAMLWKDNELCGRKTCISLIKLASALGLTNLIVITADMNGFDPARSKSNGAEAASYKRTPPRRLANFDADRAGIETVLRRVHGEGTLSWMRRWRWFFLLTRQRMGRQPLSDEAA